MSLEGKPRAVVGTEHDQGALAQAQVAQRLENAADACVNLLDHIAVETASTVPGKGW